MVWDVIVVGAGPAGCQAAWHLHQLGHRVLLLDRHDFPRRKACGGMLSPLAVSLLPFDIAGVYRGISQATLIRLTDGRYQTSSQQAFLTERSEFDDYFFRQVTEGAGVPFRRITGLRKLACRAGHVDIHTRERQLLQARWVVAADGANSTVRRLLSGTPLTQGVALEVNVPCRAGIADVPVGFDFSWVEKGYAWYFPKGDHMNIGLGSFSRAQLNREAIARLLRDYPAVTRADVFGAPLTPYVGGAALGERRVLFAGDAAGLVDPVSGEGIFEALYSGRNCALAIDQGRNADQVLPLYTRLMADLEERLGRKLLAARHLYLDGADIDGAELEIYR